MRTLLLLLSGIAALGFVSYKNANKNPVPAATPATTAFATTGATELIYQSRDGGQNWQDISDGLPKEFGLIGSFVRDGKIYMASEKEIYQGSAVMAAPQWALENMPLERTNAVYQLKSGVVIRNQSKVFLQEVPGLGVWSEVFPGLKGKIVNSFYESGQIILAGCEFGLFRSTDGGKAWTQVFPEKTHHFELNWVRDIYEVPGAVIAQSGSGLLTSHDGGQNWDIDADFWQKQIGADGYVSFSAPIKGQLVAISNRLYKPKHYASHVYTSSDLGKTWKPDSDRFPFTSVAQILEVGETLTVRHHDGISISRDQGKTWQLVFSYIGENRNFRLLNENGVLYLVKDFGC
jgi:photosystem II stability/assembly factor-like uncharacterized protein